MLSHLSRVWLIVTPWTVACQAPMSMGFSRQEYWSGLPCPPLGDLPDPGDIPDLGIKCMSPGSLALQVDSWTFKNSVSSPEERWCDDEVHAMKPEHQAQVPTPGHPPAGHVLTWSPRLSFFGGITGLITAPICPILLIIREMQIKATKRVTSHGSECPSLKTRQIINDGKDVERRELSYTVGGNVSWCSLYGEQYGGSTEN